MELFRSPTKALYDAVPAGSLPVHAEHAVQFYESDSYLCEAVAAFLADGLTRGQPVVVIAAPARREAFAAGMIALGCEVQQEELAGRLTWLDAEDTLELFMVDGAPDAHRFATIVGAVFSRASTAFSGASVRAYGEMVDILWQRGAHGAAIRLEEMWNDLAANHPFSLLCAYAMGNFVGEAHAEHFHEICHRHSHVIPAESYAFAQDDVGRSREIARLQQRALALEAEVEQRKKLERALRTALAERRQVEEALRAARDEAEASARVKSEFLAVMSHELRTPLNAIVGYHDLLDREICGPITADQRIYLGRISTAAEQLLALISQILQLARADAVRDELRPEETDLTVLAAQAGSLVEPGAMKKKLHLVMELPDAPVICETDSAKLGQILLNLLANAVKFTAEGTVRMTLTTSPGWACFEVADTGIGIGAEDLARIFEPFVQVDTSSTRRHGGTGLGLAVSRQLAELLGGELVVDSTVGAGSKFTLRLPLAQSRAIAS